MYYGRFVFILFLLVPKFERAQDTPLEQTLKLVKPHLSPQFTQKWSRHTHGAADTCNNAIVIDGLWKIHRLKCAYENVSVITEEFGKIETG